MEATTCLSNQQQNPPKNPKYGKKFKYQNWDPPKVPAGKENSDT